MKPGALGRVGGRASLFPVPAALPHRHRLGEESRAAGRPAPLRDGPALESGQSGTRPGPSPSPPAEPGPGRPGRGPGGCLYCPGPGAWLPNKGPRAPSPAGLPRPGGTNGESWEPRPLTGEAGRFRVGPGGRR